MPGGHCGARLWRQKEIGGGKMVKHLKNWTNWTQTRGNSEKARSAIKVPVKYRRNTFNVCNEKGLFSVSSYYQHLNI